MFYVQAANGMLFQEVLELQVQVHDRFQEWRSAGVFRRMWIDGLSMIKRLGLIGNGKLWMVLLQRHLLGEKGTGANPTDRVS